MSKFVSGLSTVAVLVLAAVPALGLTQAAQAGPRAKPVAHVKIGDLDLARPSHAAEFHHRVDVAGDRFCQARARAERLRTLSVRACRSDFRMDARAELSPERLRALRNGERAQRTQLSAR